MNFITVCCVIFLYQMNSIQTFNSPNVCGIKFKNKIVGGSDALPNEWPWMHICGATLIDRQWILSAAHCFLFNSVSAYKVILGGHNLSVSGLSTNKIRRSVSAIIKHELFTNDRAYDIALLKLERPVDFSMDILPACLASSEDNYENQTCFFAGWGHTFSNGGTQSTLRHVELKVLSKPECAEMVFDKPEQKYCTGRMESVQDTCQGDSGGGMVCQKANLKWYIAGIVSYGLGKCGNIGINARVDYFREWINSKLIQS